MAKLYTCKGDKGYTDLANGKRVLKDSVLIELIGTLDEASSVLGASKVFAKNEELGNDIEAIQKMTFSVMAELAGGKTSLTDETIKNVEDMTDKYSDGFSGFTFSGTNEASAFLDVARCVMRRAERIAVKAFRKKTDNAGGNVLVKSYFRPFICNGTICRKRIDRKGFYLCTSMKMNFLGL